MKRYIKLFLIIAFFAIVGSVMVSCDETITGTGKNSYKFVNESSYDIKVSSDKTTIFKEFTVQSKKTVILYTDESRIDYIFTHSNRVVVYNKDSRTIIFRDK
jgi:hypothetical protein